MDKMLHCLWISISQVTTGYNHALSITYIYALLMISRSQFMIENWEKKSMLLPMEIDRCINYQSDSHECFIINAYQ